MDRAKAHRRRALLSTSLLATALVLVGIGLRVAPLLDTNRTLRQYPTEDGYLMLTVARNLALGRGMTVSAGEVSTNGVQPLMTGVWSLAFAAYNGDREAGVRAVQMISIVVAVAALAVLFLLAVELGPPGPGSRVTATLISALWFASPVVIRHTMNCQETGAVLLATLVVVLLFVRWTGRSLPGEWPLWRGVALGSVLGVTFWIRNDAVFLAAATCFALVAVDGWRWRSLRVAATSGTVAGLVAAPWLIHNVVCFGNVVPTSGLAEAAIGHAGEGLLKAPVKLLEYASVVADVPPLLEPRPWVIAVSTALLAVFVLVATRYCPRSRAARRAAWVVGPFAVLLVAFYGIAFGATWFMDRFLAPLSPFLALVTAATTVAVLDKAPRRLAGFGATLALVAAFAMVGFLGLYHYRHGTHHIHFQLHEWVQQNLGDETWVAAFQSGTLGFFHDRTVNLDGKVNRDALRATSKRELIRYLDRTPVRFLLDWYGLAKWNELDFVRERYELVVADPERNLAVFRRLTAPPPDASPRTRVTGSEAVTALRPRSPVPRAGR